MDIIIKINSGANLFDEKLAIPITVIIFSIFEALACFLQPSKCRTDNITLMHSSTCTLLFQGMFTIQHPAFRISIICLGRHLVMGNKHKSSFNKICRLCENLLFDITHNIFHHPPAVLCHNGKEDILSILDNIRSFVSIKIQ